MPKILGAHNLTPAQRDCIFKLSEQCFPKELIALTFSCDIRTVERTLENYKARGHFKELPRSGRPPKINPRGLRHLERVVDGDRRQTLGDITKFMNTCLPSPVAPRTVQRAIHNKLLYYARHAVTKPYLKPCHIERRLDWARTATAYGMEEFSRIIWTDECSIELGKSSRTPWVWRRPHEKYDPRCINPSFKSGRSSIMFWGCIAYNRKGPLVFIPKDRRTGADYVNLVMAGPLWDFYSELMEERGIAKVMEDGAPVHTCKFAKEFRISHSLDTFPHPAQSPDMNPLEHVWYLLKDRISKREQIPKNLEELQQVVLEEWEKIDIQTINNLIDSMPNRVQALLKAKGGPTKY